MAHVGEKRASEKQVPKADDDDKEAVPPKRPAPGGGFTFRPSPLTKSAQGFLKPSGFKSEPPKFGASPAAAEPDTNEKLQPIGGFQGGFQKLNSEDLKPITITTPTIMLSGGGDGLGRLGSPDVGDQRSDGLSATNHNDVERHKNPFLQFLSTSSSASFSSLSGSVAGGNSGGGSDGGGRAAFVGPSSSPPEGQGDNGENPTRDKDEGHEPEADSSVESDPLLATPTVPFGSQPATALLPEIQTPTGEEGEKKIVQVPARLYVFDVVTHSWKERGRGEVRLNDACQSEGVFQSRIVMRASGSYRVLLNTHLWAQMKCDRANQKSIRITAQDPQGLISVFLIMGAPKDVQQLFTAIDRRVEALRRNAEYSQEGSESQQEAGTRPDSQNVSFDEDDKESFLDDPHSSPDSSPDAHSHARRLRQVENPVSIPEQQSVPIPDLPGSDNEEQDASSNKDLSSGKESPTVETESGIDSTSV